LRPAEALSKLSTGLARDGGEFYRRCTPCLPIGCSADALQCLEEFPLRTVPTAQPLTLSSLIPCCCAPRPSSCFRAEGTALHLRAVADGPIAAPKDEA